MNAREVWLWYTMELRSALRERHIVVNSLLLPVMLYPAIFWLMLSGFTFVRGQTEGLTSRIVVTGSADARDAVAERLRAVPKVTVRTSDEAAGSFDAAIRAGTTDAVLEVTSPPAGDASRAFVGVSVLGAARYGLRYDGSKDRSSVASERIRTAVDEARRDALLAEAGTRGIGPDAWQAFHVGRVDTATKEEVGALVLKLLAPTILVVMISLGCFYPAVDATAGERERGTWETALSTASSRASIVTAKYLYVATLGCVAGLLNITAMVISLGPLLRQFTQGIGEKAAFRIPPAAIPVTVAGTVLVALFVAAGLMILASFARTFKEGQSMASPFYLISMLPIIMLNSPDLALSLPLALVPVANVMMVIREAIAGTYNWPLIGVTAAVGVLTVTACLAIATRVLAFEDVLVGSFNGSFFAFARSRFGAGKRRGGKGESA